MPADPHDAREALARLLAPLAWAALGHADTLAQKNRRAASLRHADDILAAGWTPPAPDVPAPASEAQQALSWNVTPDLAGVVLYHQHMAAFARENSPEQRVHEAAADFIRTLSPLPLLQQAGDVREAAAAWSYSRATARTTSGKPAMWVRCLSEAEPTHDDMTRDITPLFRALPAPEPAGDVREAAAKAIAFAGRDPHDMSRDAEEFWANSASAHGRYRAMADAAIRALPAPEVTEERVERVARALHEEREDMRDDWSPFTERVAWEDDTEQGKAISRRLARAALAALQPGEVASPIADRIIAAGWTPPVDAPPRYQAVADARRDAEGQMDTLREVVRRRRNLPPVAGDVREAAPLFPVPDLRSDPNAVHINMLRGTIAKPTPEQIVHIYGVEALARALSALEVTDAIRHALGGFESIRRCAVETGADQFITTCAVRHIELLTAALQPGEGGR